MVIYLKVRQTRENSMSGKYFGIEAERVMVAANALLSMAGKRQRLTVCTGSLERGYQFRSATRKTIVVPVSRIQGIYSGIRSILQRVDEKRCSNWLINGQADTNMQELVFVGGYNAVIQYDRKDVFQFQAELLQDSGLARTDHELFTTEIARRVSQIEADVNLPAFPDETLLITRDEHDQPHSHRFSLLELEFTKAA